jgi:hypothetical protein
MLSNSRSLSCVTLVSLKKWGGFSIVFNHKLNSDFKSHLIFRGTQERLIALLENVNKTSPLSNKQKSLWPNNMERKTSLAKKKKKKKGISIY